MQQVGRRSHVVPILRDEFLELRFEYVLQKYRRLVNVLLLIIVENGVVEY